MTLKEGKWGMKNKMGSTSHYATMLGKDLATFIGEINI
jgi:hypothetical protein